MNMHHGNPALAERAEVLMLMAQRLLDEAHLSLPAVHLQSALDMLRHESNGWSAREEFVAGL